MRKSFIFAITLLQSSSIIAVSYPGEETGMDSWGKPSPSFSYEAGSEEKKTSFFEPNQFSRDLRLSMPTEVELKRMGKDLHESWPTFPLGKLNKLIDSVMILQKGWSNGQEDDYLRRLSEEPTQRLQVVASLANFMYAYSRLHQDINEENKNKPQKKGLDHHQLQLQVMKEEAEKMGQIKFLTQKMEAQDAEIKVFQSKLGEAQKQYDDALKALENKRKEKEEKRRALFEEEKSQWQSNPGVMRDQAEAEIRAQLSVVAPKERINKIKDIIRKGITTPATVWALGRLIREMPKEHHFPLLVALIKGTPPSHPCREDVLGVTESLMPHLSISRQVSLLKNVLSGDQNERLLHFAQMLYGYSSKAQTLFMGDRLEKQVRNSTEWQETEVDEGLKKRVNMNASRRQEKGRKQFLRSFLMSENNLHPVLLATVAHKISTFSTRDQEDLWSVFIDRHLTTDRGVELLLQGIVALPSRERLNLLIKFLKQEKDSIVQAQALTRTLAWLPFNEQQTLLEQLKRRGAGDLSYLAPEEFTPAQPVFSPQDFSSKRDSKNNDSYDLDGKDWCSSDDADESEEETEKMPSKDSILMAEANLHREMEKKEALVREKHLLERKMEEIKMKLKRIQESFLRGKKSPSKKEILLNKALPLVNSVSIMYGKFFQLASDSQSPYADGWGQTLMEAGVNDEREFEFVYKASRSLPLESKSRVWDGIASSSHEFIKEKGLSSALELISVDPEEAEAALSMFVERLHNEMPTIKAVLRLSFEKPELLFSGVLLRKLVHLESRNKDLISGILIGAARVPKDHAFFQVIPDIVRSNPQAEFIIQGVLNLLSKSPALLDVLVSVNPAHLKVIEVTFNYASHVFGDKRVYQWIHKIIAENPKNKTVPENDKNKLVIKRVLEMIRQQERPSQERVALFVQLRKHNPFSLSVVQEGRLLAKELSRGSLEEQSLKKAVENALGKYKDSGMMDSWNLNQA